MKLRGGDGTRRVNSTNNFLSSFVGLNHLFATNLKETFCVVKQSGEKQERTAVVQNRFAL